MKILIIQTAFIGDVVLATALAEKLHACHPTAQIHFLLREGNETLLSDHPFINHIWIWKKRRHKYRNLFRLLFAIRSARFDAVINCQRFAASGFLAALSGAGIRTGFSKNPLSFLFTERHAHNVGNKGGGVFLHEVERNQLLIASLTDQDAARPKLYPHERDFIAVEKYKSGPYVTICPASVWSTKQWPPVKWIELVRSIPEQYSIYLLGAGSDSRLADEIINLEPDRRLRNLCGAFSFLQTTALMKDAAMNYVNDSAPLHFASAINANVTAVFCSTIPQFGFGPLSDNSHILEIREPLHCRPCGLHGFKECPEKHFHCALKVEAKSFLTA